MDFKELIEEFRAEIDKLEADVSARLHGMFDRLVGHVGPVEAEAKNDAEQVVHDAETAAAPVAAEAVHDAEHVAQDAVAAAKDTVEPPAAAAPAVDEAPAETAAPAADVATT